MTLMWFDTIDSVKAFMGADYQTAHVPEQAQAVPLVPVLARGQSGSPRP